VGILLEKLPKLTTNVTLTLSQGCSLHFACCGDLVIKLLSGIAAGGAYQQEAGFSGELGMATTNLIRERIAAFARELSEELGAVDETKGVCWLDAVENQAVEIGDAVHAELVKQRSTSRPSGEESTCPECGQVGRYQDLRERELIGRRGPVAIREAEYYCSACRRAFFPDDSSDRR
jgi:hypothetical protein